MEYTVQKLARLSGVSGRTLRYYDQIDLLKPARINSSGYRIYGQKEVDQLQHILFYRELEVSLDEIKKIMNDPEYDEAEALQQHFEKLAKKRARLDRLLETVEKTIASKKGGFSMQMSIVVLIISILLFFVLFFGIGFILNMLLRMSWIMAIIYPIIAIFIVDNVKFIEYITNSKIAFQELGQKLGSLATADVLILLSGLAGAIAAGVTIKMLRKNGYQMF